MFAKIYQPSPSAMTSGRAKSNHWVLEFVTKGKSIIDPFKRQVVGSSPTGPATPNK